MRLADKSIVVTGATGLGAATARRAAMEGGAVFVISLGEPECASLVTAIESEGGKAAFRVADLTVEAEVDDAFDEATDYLGGLDGLFAVAGGSGRRFGDGPAHEIDLVAWEKTLQINTHPMFLATSRALGLMRAKGGSIVLVGSVLATDPSPIHFATHAYASAKGATSSFARALAGFYAVDGIRVNVITPGLVRTPMSARAADDPEVVAYVARKQPLAGGLLEPEAVAATAVFLLSDESRQITGQQIAVDGGWGVTEA